MKIFKLIIVFLIAAFLLLGIGLFIFIKTFDINKYKSVIEQTASAHIGRDITIGRLDLSLNLADGLILNVYKLAIADDPSFSKETFVSLERLKLNVDVEAFLSKKEILVSDVGIYAPHIRIIKNQADKLNVEQFENSSQKTEPAAQSSQQHNQSPPFLDSQENPFNNTNLSIQSIQIHDGRIDFIDLKKNFTITTERIDFEALDFSFNNPFSFKASASLLSNAKNFFAKGTAHLDIQNQQARLDDLTVESDLSLISLTKVKKVFTELEELGLPNVINGNFKMDVSQIVAGKEGLLLLSGKGDVFVDELKLKKLPTKIEKIRLQFELTENDLTITQFLAYVEKGTVEGDGSVEDYTAQKAINIHLGVREIALGEILPPFDPVIRFEGVLNSQLDIQALGASADIIKDLEGRGEFNVKNGQLVNLNVLKFILNKISFVPNLANKIYDNIPEKYKHQLNSNNTVFEKINADFYVNNGKATFNSAELRADSFSLIASGWVDWEENISLTSTVYLPLDLSQGMIKSVSELSVLLGDDGRITIPLQKYEGKIANLKVYPNVEHLFKNIIQQKGKQEIQKLLDKVFDIEKDTSSPETDGTQQPTGSNQDSQKSPEEQIIENVLDTLGTIFE